MSSRAPKRQESIWRISTTRVRIAICFAALTFLLTCLALASYSQSGLGGFELVNHAAHTDDPLCEYFPDPGNVAVTVKTGATELHAKVPVLLATSLRCVKDPILLSDLDQKLGPHLVHDVLSNYSSMETRFNPDFDIYRLQKEYKRTGREAEILELSMYPATSKTNGNRKAAWALDRYKFLYMIERSWELQPGKDWYFFMDADTYVNWPNFLRWLPMLDPTQMKYIGHLIGYGPYPSELVLYFAHGGAGFLLSRATVEAFVNRQPSIAKEWESRIAQITLGDAALAIALAEEFGVYLTDGHFSITEGEPNNTAFGAGSWCRPLLTLHHIKTEAHALSMFHAGQYSSAMFRDLYNFIHPEPFRYPEFLDDWDNQARDDNTWDWGTSLEVETSNVNGTCLRSQRPEHQGDPHCSFEACKLACSQNERCMQFLFRTTVLREGGEQMTVCSHSGAFRMGRKRRVEIDEFGDRLELSVKYRSGWMPDRIARWVAENRDCRHKDLIWPGV